MERKSFCISNLKKVREGLDRALQTAMAARDQKGADEVTVTLGVRVSIDKSGRERVDYKTKVRVPMDINDEGSETFEQITWDEAEHEYSINMSGEQLSV
jgi:preprotein translocase subunit SecD